MTSEKRMISEMTVQQRHHHSVKKRFILFYEYAIERLRDIYLNGDHKLSAKNEPRSKIFSSV